MSVWSFFQLCILTLIICLFLRELRDITFSLSPFSCLSLDHLCLILFFRVCRLKVDSALSVFFANFKHFSGLSELIFNHCSIVFPFHLCLSGTSLVFYRLGKGFYFLVLQGRERFALL